MKFGLVLTEKKLFEVIDAENLQAAEAQAGLPPHEIDHGILNEELGIVVGEFSMFDERKHFFSINKKLFCGNAVIYQFDERGVTQDFEDTDSITSRLAWYNDQHSVEIAIMAGRIIRPEMTINGQVYWRWPSAKPDWLK